MTYGSTMNWEYMVIDTDVAHTQDLTVQLSALGSLGWEAVGYTCTVQIGPNGMSVLMKRPAPCLAPPAEATAGWNSDPSGRFEVRHWDGQRWTQHVSTGGTTSTDFPNVR